MISQGDPENAESRFRNLFNKLSVEDHENYPKWLKREFKIWLADDYEEWVYNNKRRNKNKLIEENSTIRENWIEDIKKIDNYPAYQFCNDLDAILELKDLMTRRQWTNIIETNLRLATASHILWFKVNFNIWELIRQTLKGNIEVNIKHVHERIYNTNREYLRIGQPVRRIYEDIISKYLQGR